MSGRRSHNFVVAVIGVAALLCLLGARAVAWGAGGPGREYRLKAAFVYHFLQFTDWPAEAFAASDAPIVVAVVGEDPVDGALSQAMAGKTVGGRLVRFVHVPDPSNMGVAMGGAEPMECHLIYIARSLEPPEMERVLRQVRGAPVLTISDADREFTRAGGVLRLLVEENRVRFEVNLTAVQRQQLKMSARLLKLARVYEEPVS